MDNKKSFENKEAGTEALDELQARLKTASDEDFAALLKCNEAATLEEFEHAKKEFDIVHARWQGVADERQERLTRTLKENRERWKEALEVMRSEGGAERS